mmetsp:Transcript_16023/g.40259  ORF Transcript_16023/g.40259 Transcript_16023/m.40259 type:complete len:93 (-) Transcript_16023:921-1199(-)
MNVVIQSKLAERSMSPEYYDIPLPLLILSGEWEDPPLFHIPAQLERSKDRVLANWYRSSSLRWPRSNTGSEPEGPLRLDSVLAPSLQLSESL